MFGSKNLAQILQAHSGALQVNLSCMHDLHDSPAWRAAYSADGIFKGDHRGLLFAFYADGVNSFSHNRVPHSMRPMMLTLLNLPRDIRNSFGNIFLLGIVPGNGSQEPKSLDPYLEVFVDEFLELSNGTTMYDAYKDVSFQLKTEILLYVL